MARAPALANVIADGIVTALGAIDNVASPNTYLTQPRTVRRGNVAIVITQPKDPALCVEVAKVSSDPIGSERHTIIVAISVHMKVSGRDTAETDINALAADVMYVLDQNETFAAIAEQMVQPLGIEYEPQTELMEGHSGMGVATLTASYELLYDHTLTTPP